MLGKRLVSRLGTRRVCVADRAQQVCARTPLPAHRAPADPTLSTAQCRDARSVTVACRSASDGLNARDDSTLLLERCTVDKTGHLGGIGVFGCKRSKVLLSSCELLHNDHAIGYNEATTMQASEPAATFAKHASTKHSLVTNCRKRSRMPFLGSASPIALPPPNHRC